MDRISFDPEDGPIIVEVLILPTAHCSYEVLQHDPMGSFQKPIMRGTNIAAASDSFPVATPLEELDGSYFEWKVFFADAERITGQEYRISIALRQGDEMLPGAPILREGVLRGEPMTFGFLRLIANRC